VFGRGFLPLHHGDFRLPVGRSATGSPPRVVSPFAKSQRARTPYPARLRLYREAGGPKYSDATEEQRQSRPHSSLALHGVAPGTRPSRASSARLERSKRMAQRSSAGQGLDITYQRKVSSQPKRHHMGTTNTTDKRELVRVATGVQTRNDSRPCQRTPGETANCGSLIRWIRTASVQK
jgi:hypothetical protein